MYLNHDDISSDDSPRYLVCLRFEQRHRGLEEPKEIQLK
jgi:hypothetical protein